MNKIKLIIEQNLKKYQSLKRKICKWRFEDEYLIRWAFQHSNPSHLQSHPRPLGRIYVYRHIVIQPVSTPFFDVLGGLETIHAIKRRIKRKAPLIKVHILLLVKHIKTNKHPPSQPLWAPRRRILNYMLIRRTHKLLGSCYCVYRVNNGCYWLMYIITLHGGTFSWRMLRRTRRTSSSLGYANFHHGKLHCMCATRARVANRRRADGDELVSELKTKEF